MFPNKLRLETAEKPFASAFSQAALRPGLRWFHPGARRPATNRPNRQAKLPPGPGRKLLSFDSCFFLEIILLSTSACAGLEVEAGIRCTDTGERTRRRRWTWPTQGPIHSGGPSRPSTSGRAEQGRAPVRRVPLSLGIFTCIFRDADSGCD